MATKTFKVALSLDNPRLIQSGIDVRSFDKQSIKIAIELTKNSQVYQIPTGSQIKISLLKLARQEQKIILDVPFTSAEAIEWLVPDYLDGYQGEVRVGVYLIVGAENIDVGYFNIASKVSDIDKAAEEFTDNVMQGWNQIEADLAEIRDMSTQFEALASDVTSKYNAFDSSVTQAGQTIDDILALQPQFQSVLDETTGKDIISAPEIILARDGAQTLGERLDSDKAEVTAQLAQTGKVLEYESNADLPLHIPTYDGGNQTVHPDVVFIQGGFGGFGYWMAHTPYPFSNDKYENPSILCSVDGVNWKTPAGLTNPIFLPTTESMADGHHASDAILVYRPDLKRLECIWRWNKNGSTEQLYRQTSSNGVDWSTKELIFDLTGGGSVSSVALSPSCIYENGKYKMWFVGSGLHMYYMESTTGNINTWSVPEICTITNNSYDNWHLHITKIDGLFHTVLNANKPETPNVRVLLHSTSVDGKIFKEPTLIMKPRIGHAYWDNQSLYRGSLIKVKGVYKLYYSAYSTNSRFHIALSEGTDINALVGSTNYSEDGKNTSIYTKSDIVESRSILVHGADVGNGNSVFKMTSPDVLGVRNDSDARFNDFQARNLRSEKVYLGTGELIGRLNYDVNGFSLYDETGVELKNLTHNRSIVREVQVAETGLGSTLFRLVEPDVLGVRNVANTSYVDFRAKYLKGEQLKLGNKTTAEGSIRYNESVKKHQGYDGAVWHDLY